jgi:hypothetical protein
MRTTILVCALAACLAPGALGDVVNVIHQYNAYYDDPNNPGYPFYEIFPPPSNDVTIFHGVEGQTFEFEAALENNGAYEGPGDIGGIYADADAGTVTISIVGHNGHAYGARDVGTIRISRTGVAGAIEALTISGDLNAQGPTQADGTGALNIGGDVVRYVEITQGILTITVGGVLDGNISCYSLGDVTVVGSPTAVHNGSIDVTSGLYNDDLYIGGSMGPTSQIWLQAGLGPDGSVQVTGDIPGMLRMPYVWSTATIEVGGGVGVCWVEGWFHGALTIGDTARLPTSLFVDWEVGRFATITVTGDLSWAVFEGLFDGTMTVTGTLTYCELHGLSLAGSIQAGAIGTLTDYDAYNGLVDAGSALGSAALYGGLGSNGVLTTTGAIGDVTVFSTLAGTVDAGSLGAMNVPYGDLSGQVFVHQDFDGSIQVGSSTHVRDLTGTLEFAQDFGDAAVEVSGNLGSVFNPGQIKIDGPFGNVPGSLQIHVYGALVNAGSFVAVDYDGYDANHPDRWGEYGQVTIGDVTYTKNTPWALIYEISTCKGDLDGTGAVDFDDIDPFVLALSDPDGYAEALPGLVGSMVFHADCNCDGVVNFDDVGPFIARLSMECDPGCPGDEQMMGAQQLATGMRAHVPAARHPALRAFVTQVIGHHHNRGNQQQRAYWAQVLAGLQ